MSQNCALRDFGPHVITAAASQGLVAGSVLADRQVWLEASPAHRSAEPGPLMPASFHCRHPGICLCWNDNLSAEWLVWHVAKPLLTDKRTMSTDRF